MNQLDRQRQINENARLIDFHSRSGSHVNCIRINTNNSLEHEMEKLKICYNLKKEGRDFLTEAVFENKKGIADIVDLVLGIIIEVQHTESDESIKNKSLKYPLEMEVVRV